MSKLAHLLNESFGFEQFREGQQQTIETLLAGYSALAIFPTGAGKSLCYQFTALQLPHITLVVSPLLALMKDQLAFLQAKGIAAASIDSSQTKDESATIIRNVKAGKIKILMVSVERFKNERFRHFIESIPISLLVIDEAHCISEWGHNFRPDYLKLPEYQRSLNIPQVLLLTATATRKVKRDMASKFSIQAAHITQTGFYRKNLDLAVVPTNENNKKSALIAQLKHCTEGTKQLGIVYVTLQKTAQILADYLVEHGFSAAAYHAGLKDEERQRVQSQFMNSDIDIVVATIAFGMGVDKANIRFVIHYDLPKSIENYSQEIGRAGRDGLNAQCTVLANLDGITTVENFVYGDTPELYSIETVLDEIKHNAVVPVDSHTNNQEWGSQLYHLSIKSNIRQLVLKTVLVQLEMKGVISAKYSYFSEYKIKPLHDINSITLNFTGERHTFLQAIWDATTFKRTWGVLDFEALNQVYPTDRKRVITALEYLQDKELIELQVSGTVDVYNVDSAKLTSALASELAAYFMQSEQAEIKRIAALVRYFQLDKCLSANLALYFDDDTVPEQCGHCSVCRGEVAKLAYSSVSEIPATERVKLWLDELSDLVNKTAHECQLNTISLDMKCRFLAGMTSPLFTKIKARQLSGWGQCESIRYNEIKNVVMLIN